MNKTKHTNGDRHTEFESAFSYYGRGLLAYAREFVDSQEEAEDIVSEVFANFWEKIGTLSSEAFRTYLFRSAKNKALNHLARLKVRTSYQNVIIKQQDAPDSFDPELYVASELQSRIDAAIEKLPPQRRLIFMMNRFDNKTYSQIAEELGISPRTVDKHIELSVKSLKASLSDYLLLIMFLILAYCCKDPGIYK